MRSVYLSFLGLGTFNQETRRHEYKPTVYRLNGRDSGSTEFVQLAEIEILGASAFDLVVMVATERSRDTHFGKLEVGLRTLGVTDISRVILGEDMSPEGQWAWFEQISRRIEYGDDITVDLTHGYRSIPIVFSTAINFLQKARRVTVKAVYYGVYEKERALGYAPIVDMKDFYVINEWAEGVSRLVEDADARKMADVAGRSSGFQSGSLNDHEIIGALGALTDTIRNVDVNHVAAKARNALRLISAKKKNASETGRILLDLVVDKFACLAMDEPQGYTRDYFAIQFELAGLLLEHKLHMQAYTVMREVIGSIGMVGVAKGDRLSNSGRSRRKTYSEVFVNMLQFDESEWKFPEGSLPLKTKLEPYYTRLKEAGVVATLRGFTRELVDYRNGFDHAWTAKAQAYGDIDKKGEEMHRSLRVALDKMVEAGIL